MAVVSDTIDRDPDILATKRERLRALKQQAALFGRETPPHITIEIGEIEREIKLANVPLDPAERHLELRRLITRIGYGLAANISATIILLLVVLVLLARDAPRQAQQPTAAPAPTAGTAAPATTPIAGGSAPQEIANAHPRPDQ